MQVMGDGEQKIAVIADIVDGQGQHLYKLDELIDEALSKLEALIKKYNCT